MLVANLVMVHGLTAHMVMADIAMTLIPSSSQNARAMRRAATAKKVCKDPSIDRCIDICMDKCIHPTVCMCLDIVVNPVYSYIYITCVDTNVNLFIAIYIYNVRGHKCEPVYSSIYITSVDTNVNLLIALYI